MDETSQLASAIQFVTGKIEEEAMRSGVPLTEEQHVLLRNLPMQPTTPEAYSTDPEFLPLIVPQDLAFERLCALAKAAHGRDLQLNPEDRNWQFARAVAELHQHPMSWLLGWAGVNVPRPWWDRFLLIMTALISISVWMFLMFIGTETRVRFRWLILAMGCSAVVAAMWFGTRRLERFQLRQTIDRCRSK